MVSPNCLSVSSLIHMFLKDYLRKATNYVSHCPQNFNPVLNHHCVLYMAIYSQLVVMV